MMLVFSHIVSTDPRARSFYDNRHRVHRTTASYRAPNGDEYRKVFEAKGRGPQVPTTLDNDADNSAIYKQW